MADSNKLAQSAPLATTLTDLYTVPALTQATVSSLIICNRSLVPTAARVSLAPAGAADANSQYIFYDLEIPANDTFTATIGILLATTDKIRVYAAAANLSFTACLVEHT